MIDVTTIATLENLQTHSQEEILELFNTLLKAQGKKARKKVTAEECFKLLQQTRGEDVPEDAKDEKPAKEKKPRAPSYQEKLRQWFDAKGFGTKSELTEHTGADEKNLSVAVSILKNPARCKDTRDVAYLRSTQTYYCIGNEMGAEAYKKAVAVVEEEKAAKAKAKKEKAAKAKEAEKAKQEEATAS